MSNHSDRRVLSKAVGATSALLRGPPRAAESGDEPGRTRHIPLVLASPNAAIASRLLIVVPPAETEKVVREADAAGVKNVWMQQGAESEAAIQYCQQHGLNEVHGEFIMMSASPVTSYHRWHRGAWKLFGKLPK